MADTQQGESSTPHHLASFWRCIWKLPIPNKIKAFAWRACRNILLTKANLHSRKVTPDSICEECGVTVESSGHVFWHCARAKEVWLAANIELGAEVGEVSGACKLASTIAHWTIDYLEEFLVANHKIQVKKPVTEIGWTVPHPPCLKINVDGAVFERQRCVGIGVVVRDHSGVGVSAAFFEGDSMVVFKSLTGSITPPSSICNLITGSLLQAARIGECKFSVMPRSGNRAAYGLAQFAKNLSDSCTWIGDTPPFLEQLVFQDVLFSSSS
uniref:Reverse transcriptase zinc-binding domain-containing protein n=1 Tax=Quercus lobata TaxID=97700 RepID=A0A7N2MAB1_QUELO